MTDTATTEYTRLTGDGAPLEAGPDANGDDGPKTPFDDVEAAFAADLPGRRFDFKMLGQDCFVELRPLDAQDFATYESAGSKMHLDPNRRTVETIQVEVDRGKQELFLLVGTVVDFALARKRRMRSGDEMIEMTLSAGMGRPAREAIFKSLSRAFRQVLVVECQKVNGIGPFAPE